MSIFISLIIAYFLCSIPFGLVISKVFYKEDIRKKGSGNIGATNVVRVMGKKAGYITFCLDAIKGIVSLSIAMHCFNITDKLALSLVTLVAIIGHTYSCFLKFRGGKGVATFLAIITFMDPIIGILLALVWYLVFYITRMVALASILVIIAVALFYVLKLNLDYIGFILASFLIVYKHKENISRILKGEEHSFYKK